VAALRQQVAQWRSRRGTITSEKHGKIDVRGRLAHTAAGLAILAASGDVSLTARIDARGRSGGAVTLTSTGGDVSVEDQIRTQGAPAAGGTIDIDVAGTVTVSGKDGILLANGRGPGAGTITVNAGGLADVGIAEARGSNGVPAGTVAVLAGAVNLDLVRVSGEPGGTIEVTSTTGSVAIDSLNANGETGGNGGLISVDAATDATIASEATADGQTIGGQLHFTAGGNLALGSAHSAEFEATGQSGGVIEGAGHRQPHRDRKVQGQDGRLHWPRPPVGR
jgi:hypothetical protein